ncbi:ArsR/SmtB family transcription factor [Heyndrickxia acidicola]|uniref:Metalloregulator ArsR/SmtB family transcription factor n=1 Tax=Heyndrickxia acidicola TaxID=209389 RepID=A0ABU6MR79_9BACI|nr:metalloregulator ArsR/SmtB family transcription factor [Heyndrickxia acidicola]MED1205727.1 metalloregulator ArsR/SmtB family transcription factor [Heyndrickxia acidicola]
MKNFQPILKLKMDIPEARHDVFHGIADPTRRRILKMLVDKELPIASIAECLPISRTAVNKHLQVLSDAGLVNRKKAGREMRYTLRPEAFMEVKDWLAFFEQYWDEKLLVLKKYIEVKDGH